MNIASTRCPGCDQPMKLVRAHCEECGVFLEGEFEVSPLGRLSLEDQLFVVAFLRHHGSIKKMEQLFGISYPTVKNRLQAIVAALDRPFHVSAAPTDEQAARTAALTELERGEISVAEALRRMR